VTANSQAAKSSSSNEYEREESFTSTAPVNARISTRRGDIAVSVGEGNEIKVTLRTSSSKFNYLLDAADVTFNTQSNELDIRTQTQDSLGKGKMKRAWMDLGASDLDVFVVLPAGSSIELKTVSGDMALQGNFDEIDASSVSGDVEAFGSYSNLDVRTASGDVSVGDVANLLKCRTASGDVACLSAGALTEINSASGDVNITATQPGKINAKVVSGDVLVSVARGLAVDINGNTVSGNLESNIDLNGEGDGSGEDETVLIKATTVSGDIRIDKLRTRAEPRGPWEHGSTEEHAHVLRKGNTEIRFGRIPSSRDE
jgi:hypothetical protein